MSNRYIKPIIIIGTNNLHSRVVIDCYIMTGNVSDIVILS